MRLPAPERRYHFLGEVMPIISSLEGAAPRDMVKRCLGMLARHTKPRHTGANRAPQVVPAPTTHAGQFVHSRLELPKPAEPVAGDIPEQTPALASGITVRRPDGQQLSHGRRRQRKRDWAPVLCPAARDGPPG